MLTFAGFLLEKGASNDGGVVDNGYFLRFRWRYLGELYIDKANIIT